MWLVFEYEDGELLEVDTVFGYDFADAKEVLALENLDDGKHRVLKKGATLNAMYDLSEDDILNIEDFYLEAIRIGLLDEDTLEFNWG